MADVNVVVLAGRLTRDVEVRFTPAGTAVAAFGLAIGRKFKGKDGQLQEETTFVDAETFGKHAEACGQYLTKGSPVLLEGRLKLDTWEDKQSGQKRSKLKVIAERVHFLSSGSKSEKKQADTVPDFV